MKLAQNLSLTTKESLSLNLEVARSKSTRKEGRRSLANFLQEENRFLFKKKRSGALEQAQNIINVQLVSSIIRTPLTFPTQFSVAKEAVLT
ncbi:TPA: hypothetical protein I7730_00475 [Vibrio vulnificus]|uniref:Uncharacterized protein n=1 Tax=Vibrio vulnificus TaxID=672 RepID=A0A8H9MY99_VIBVL|nr:hypothetical protein [Vibrio vulnificus]HAS8538273.1 hypothetical protein [Vibrio vulnificus]